MRTALRACWTPRAETGRDARVFLPEKKPAMYYYSNRSTVSASAVWPGAEGHQSCCCCCVGGGGGGELTGARALRHWESATCDSANDKRITSTRDGAGLGLSRCCRGGGEGGGDDGAADGQGGGVRFPCWTGSGTAAISKRSACSIGGVSRRPCFPRTSAVFHCGGSDPDSGTGSSDEAATHNRQRRRGVRALGAAEMEATGGVINGKRRGRGPARGRVRLRRIRSFLASTEGVNANGVPAAPPSQFRPQARFSAAGSRSLTGGATGSWLKQVEAGKRQVKLEKRTDMLWRRLHAVQVKQVERHVTQQLVDLRRTSFTPNSAELLRLACSCSEALRTAGGALDSDHTASSSGGGSDSEEEEEEEEGRRSKHDLPSRVKLQWMWERAWLGSRWVWLQAQVSELEYGIRALTELYTHLRQDKVSDSSPELAIRARRTSPGPQHCRKKLAESSAPSPPAARVRPLLRRCRPRLIRLNARPALGPQTASLCGCRQPPAARVLCAPPPPPAHGTATGVGQNEPRIHPVLSMPSVFPPAAYGVAPPLVRLQTHNTAKWMEKQERKKAGRVRRRIPPPSPPGTLPSLSNTSGRSTCRNPRGVVSPGLLPQHTPDDLPHLSAGMPDTPIQPMRRRRGESSFDINNLVMPLGSAGLRAPVPKLQYKQIVTPSWREMDSAWEGSGKEMVSEGPHALQRLIAEDDEHTSVVEDLSDSVFLKRHAVWESRERSRWGSRARRRHRGRSPPPCGNGDSGLEQTPCCADPRQRRSPWHSFHYTADESFHQTLDEQQYVLAWERRSFPLMKEELYWLQDVEEAELEEEEEEEDVCAASGRSQSTDSGISEGSLELSPRKPRHINYTQEPTDRSPQLRTQTPPLPS